MGGGVGLLPVEDGTREEVGDLVELQVHRCPLATTTDIQVWASHPWVFLVVGGWVKGLVVGKGCVCGGGVGWGGVTSVP